MNKAGGMYVLGGIAFDSEVALPELPRIQHLDPLLHPVTIRLGSVPRSLPDGVQVDPFCFANASRYLLHIEGIARYMVSHGQQITVEPDAGAVPLNVRTYLLGTIFVVLCQQRGLLPLHASAVGGASGVVAFLARSGEGKSTLAAHLAERGFRVLADDVCLVDTTRTGPAMVIPTAAWLKLWRNSLDNLGREVEGLDRVFSEDEKFRLPLAAVMQPESIDKLFFLESSDASTPQIEELSQIEALPLLMNLTHHAYLLEATGQRAENFMRCGRVLSQAKAYRLKRPWDLGHLESTLDMVEKFASP